MYVFPRAGSPTITMAHGAIAMFEMPGHCATHTHTHTHIMNNVDYTQTEQPSFQRN